MVSALASPSTTTYYWRAAAKYCVCRPAFVNVTLNCDRRRERMSTASAASEEKGGDVVVQYVVLRRDLIDTWPLGSVVTQGCHASVAAIWSHKDDPVTLDYCSPENLDSMHKVTLQVKGEAQILNLSEKLKAGGIDHKLWVEQPENIPTCLATKPYPKSVVSSYFKKLQLCAFRDASRGHGSGHSDDDVINTACRIYSYTNKAQFKLDHAWRMLRNEPKWQSSPTAPSSQTGSSSKRSKVNEAGAYTSSGSNPGTPLSEGGTPDSSFVRPEGVKAAKRGATRATSSNKEPSGQFIDDFLEIRKQELKMRAEDMEMRREALKLHAADIERKKVESERKAKMKEKKAEEKANEKERKYKLLENLMARSGSLTPQEEFLKEQLMMELFTRV